MTLATTDAYMRIYVGELSEAYALKTLYNHLAQEKEKGKFPFLITCPDLTGDGVITERMREVLADVPRVADISLEERLLSSSRREKTIACFSDVRKEVGDLAIDVAILKNSVEPLSAEQKNQLREKYGVPRDQLNLVIGYASPYGYQLTRLVEKATRHAQVYLVGDYDLKSYNLSSRAKARTRAINKRGFLKDYYAIADVAVNADNMYCSTSRMHNFVEATEGGPLFMVQPVEKNQYGYRQLADLGVIKECRNTRSLILQVTSYLENFTDNSEHNARRAMHLKNTRDKYMPPITNQILNLLGVAQDNKTEDLQVFNKPGGVRVIHPESYWGHVDDLPEHYKNRRVDESLMYRRSRRDKVTLEDLKELIQHTTKRMKSKILKLF